MFTKYLALLALTAIAAAQYSYGPADSSSTAVATTVASITVASTAAASTAAAASVPSAPADTTGRINVDVGKGGLVYQPNNISAPVGTLVTFYFPSGIAHSVTQSTFENPCTYLVASSNSPAGFDSALQTAATFTINITDTEPIWFFCRQLFHCGRGMVGSINAPSSGNTFQAFQAAAVAIGSSEPTQTAASPVTGGVHGVATAVPSGDTGSSGSSGSAGSAGPSKSAGPSGSAGSPGKNGASTVAISTGLLVISALFGTLVL